MQFPPWLLLALLLLLPAARAEEPAPAPPPAAEFAPADAVPDAAPAVPAASAPAGSNGTTTHPDGIEFTWTLDPYYSDAGVRVPLSDRPIPDGGTMREREVYRGLLRESLRPRLLLVEASVYPLPAAGTWLKKHHADFYDDFSIAKIDGNDLNVIDGLTAGFQEPWALSAFVGGEMVFTRPDDSRRKGNHGYMGYLVSFGRKHIRDNVLIDDTWWEFEWKLKGEREFRDENLSWSFRVGVKNHGNPDIRDVTYVGFRRSHLDFRQPILQLLTNSSMELMTEVARDNGHFLRQEIIFGKKVPIRRWRIAPMLEMGLIIEDAAKYTGLLVDPAADEVTVVFRPNIEW